MNDPADLDGDGRFDAIEIVIIEGENGIGKKETAGNKPGGFLMLFISALTISAGWWMGFYLT